MKPLYPAPSPGHAVPGEVQERVRVYIIENFLMGDSELAIQADTSFIDTGIVDSVGFIEIIAFLEESYGIVIEDEEMVPENLDSLRSIESFVTRKRGR